MSNSNETANDAVNQDNERSNEVPREESKQEKSADSVSANEPSDKTVADARPAKKSSRKVAPRKKDSNSSEAKNDDQSGSRGVRKEPIQGVRDSRTKKDEADEVSQPQASESQCEEQDVSRPPHESRRDNDNDSQDQDDDQSQGSNNRNRRGRRGRKSGEQSPQAPVQERIKLDQKDLTAKAWKIFLGEVNEEGLALIGDKEAREMAKRSFRLAELFLEEDGRRKPSKSKKGSARREEESPVSGD